MYRSRIALFLLSGCFVLLGSLPVFSQSTMISYGSVWSYLDNGTNQGTAWQGTGFSDGSWATGASELGYGDGGEATVIGYGPSSTSKYITSYFRKVINIPDPTAYANFTFSLSYDDGFVVYVNGVEAGRTNMPAGTIAYNTPATSAIEESVASFTVPISMFVAGSNTIAVEMHQAAVTSTDISFNLQLTGNDAFSSTVTRGPYLQMGNQNSITIRWKTSTTTDTKVEIGTVYGTYPTVFSNATATTDHAINITGLTADTKYYYKIGNTSVMGSPDNEKFFNTLPPSGTTRKIRIAAFGDCGKNDNSFQAQTLSQYRSYLSANSIEAPDAWLLMGDNAYNAGTDAEYSSNFFSAYGSSILKNHKVYPTPGNHDYANTGARQNDHAIPYYDIFTVPAAAEIGGVASGTEAYYSFDIGDIHFLALDAYGKEGSLTRLYDTTGAQVLWIKNDLAANTKKWTIAYWHHPPYTKGSHDSDIETELINIRENFIRILERNGVDMIVCGHSHDYERSYLLNGYYKAAPANPALSEIDFNPSLHTASQSSAKYDNSANSCPYTYTSGKYKHGTVYVVAGSAGADGGVMSGYPHDAFPFSQDDGGMLYFEVDSNRLDAKFIRRDGVIADKFTIMKDVNKTAVFNTSVGMPVTLTASWPGAHNWSTTETTSSIAVTPSAAGTTNYTVTDAYGCITDQFTINTSALLALSLTDFSVKENESGVLLSWVTAEEYNNKRFRIERSADGINFTSIGTVPSKKEKNTVNTYTYQDKEAIGGTSYYRLVEEDENARATILDTRKIVLKYGKALALSIVSVTDNRLVLRITSGRESSVSVRVMDVTGKTLRRQQFTHFKGSENQQFNLPAGVYVCEISNDAGHKVVKQVVLH